MAEAADRAATLKLLKAAFLRNTIQAEVGAFALRETGVERETRDAAGTGGGRRRKTRPAESRA